MRDKTAVTELINKTREGNTEAYDELFTIIYNELKQLAYSKLKKEHSDITLSETELVHETYMKIADQDSLDIKDKSHFMAIAAHCMRQILVDHARRKNREKRGGDHEEVTYIDELFKARHQAEELLDLDEKLKELARLNDRLAKVVNLRFFGGLSIYHTAQALDVSESTVKRDWAKARGWLYKELENGE